jgi:hypothetical protein
MKAALLLASIALSTAAQAQIEVPGRGEFNDAVQQFNNSQSRFEHWLSAPPRVSPGSPVTDPAKVSLAWERCHTSGQAAFSFAHAQGLDAYYAQGVDDRKASPERREIALGLLERARDSSAGIADRVGSCLGLYRVKVMGPSNAP